MPFLVICQTALITPLETSGLSTFEAITQGACLTDRGLIPEELLLKRLAAQDPQTPSLEWDKSLRLGLLVALEALAGTAPEWIRSPETGLFVGTSKGPVTKLLAAMASPLEMSVSQACQIAWGPGALGWFIHRQLAMRGPLDVAVGACASGLLALHRAARAIDLGLCRRALVLAADASILPLFESSFANLGVLAPPDPDGHRRCRPMAPAGRGFFLSEAAAALRLEASQAPGGAGMTLEKTWSGGDGTHLLAIDRQVESLRYGLEVCGRLGPVAGVHAHATGTAHDLLERQAIETCCPGAWIVSHKRYIGHSLGAAGLVSLVLSSQCHRHGASFEGHRLGPGESSLTIGQGFGGHIAMARLR